MVFQRPRDPSRSRDDFGNVRESVLFSLTGRIQVRRLTAMSFPEPRTAGVSLIPSACLRLHGHGESTRPVLPPPGAGASRVRHTQGGRHLAALVWPGPTSGARRPVCSHNSLAVGGSTCGRHGWGHGSTVPMCESRHDSLEGFGDSRLNESSWNDEN